MIIRPLDPSEDLAWQQDALCAQTDPEAFFPEKGGSTREAKAVCNGTFDRDPCPVRAACLEYALRHEERFGIFGGHSERERRQLVKDRRAALDSPELNGAA